MALINIPSTCNDPKCSYKMPKLVARIEGRGNGIKTCIVNMGDVARVLKCPPQYATEWFGSELCAKSIFTKKDEEECSLINGIYEIATLQTSLDKFIEKYLCCGSCNLPELDLKINSFSIQGKCKACGWLGNLDTGHKVADFIMKNPPDETGLSIARDGGRRLSAKERRQSMVRKQVEAEQESGDESWDLSEEDEPVKIKEKKESKSKKEKKDKKEKKAKNDEDDSFDKKEKKDKKDKREKKDKKEKKEKTEKKSKKEKVELIDEESTDDSDDMSSAGKTSACSVESRFTEYSSTRTLSIGSCHTFDFDDDETQEIVSCLVDFIDSKGGKPSVADFYDEVLSHQLTKAFDDKLRLYIVLEALFGSHMNEKALDDKKPMIEIFVKSTEIPNTDVLWAFNAYLQMHPNAAKHFALSLKQLVKQDLVDQQQFIEYYSDSGAEGQPGFLKAKTAVASLLEYLQAAPAASTKEDLPAF